MVTAKDTSRSKGMGGAGQRACWSCEEDVDLRAAFCHLCGVIQPPLPVDHFTRLGLPQNYDLKESDLERQYFGFQRSFHPDRFASKSPREQAISMEYATNINAAFDALRDPLLRAEYLLQLEGYQVAGNDGDTVSDPELLMEVMELSELIVGADTLGQAMALLERTNAEVGASEIALGVVFAENDLEQASNIALRLRYMSRLAREARQNVAKRQGGEGN